MRIPLSTLCLLAIAFAPAAGQDAADASRGAGALPAWPDWLAQCGPQPEGDPHAVLAAISGPVFYVSPDGDDDGPGSREHPWRTVGRAAAAARAGDTVLIGEGTYNERVVVANSGEPGRPITFRNYPGHHPVIDATDTGRGWGIVELRNRSHVRLIGLEVRNGRRGQCGFLTFECSDLEIRNCRSDNTGNSGIMVWQGSNILVDHNEVVRACNGGEESITVKFDSRDVQVSWNHVHHTGHEGVDVKEGSQRVRVFNNYFHHVQRQGIYADAWDRETGNIEFLRNVVHDCGFGIAVCSEKEGLLRDVLIAGNLVYDCDGPGMVFSHWNREGAGPVRNVRFVNNTVHNCGHGWGGGVTFENWEAEEIIVRNNVLSENSKQIVATRLPASGELDHNLLFGPTDEAGHDNLTGDPLFAAPGDGDFRLRPGSPAIGAGVPVAEPGDAAPADISGRAPPPGGPWTIGATQQTPN
jgi:hypothetical protein